MPIHVMHILNSFSTRRLCLEKAGRTGNILFKVVLWWRMIQCEYQRRWLSKSVLSRETQTLSNAKIFTVSLQRKNAFCDIQALKAEPKITIIHRPSGHRVSTMWNIEDINTSIPAWVRQIALRYTGNIKTAPFILFFKVIWQIKSVLKIPGFVWKANKTYG